MFKSFNYERNLWNYLYFRTYKITYEKRKYYKNNPFVTEIENYTFPQIYNSLSLKLKFEAKRKKKLN